MEPRTIVLSFDGSEQVALGSIACWIADLVNKFGFHGSKVALLISGEAAHHSEMIAPTVTESCHVPGSERIHDRLHIAGCDRSIPLRLPDFVLAAGHPGEQVDSLLRLARSPVSCDVFHARRSPGEHIRQSHRIVTRAWERVELFRNIADQQRE
jgi:hypothetical protein